MWIMNTDWIVNKQTIRQPFIRSSESGQRICVRNRLASYFFSSFSKSLAYIPLRYFSFALMWHNEC
jgi:hypothetical protein